MAIHEPSFSVGLEEEYLLVDKQTRDLVSEPPPGLMAVCEEALEGRVSPEFLRSQIEIGTPVCDSLDEARLQLGQLRATVAGVAERFGLSLLAASTHPFAKWTAQHHTDKERYRAIAEDYQVVARRLVICGMHVHVGIEDDELRIDLLNQAAYFLPHLLALSTSSPFWQGNLTGLKSYRLSVFEELPRTGLPPQFASYSEYERSVEIMVRAGLVEDASKLWWDLRPSARFPTLEMRIADVCPLLEDAIAVAALYRCILRLLYRLRRNNQRWRSYPAFLINENRWRAQRYGAEGSLVDFGMGKLVSVANLARELVDLVREDAQHFGCTREVEHILTIVERGTGADRQIRRYKALREAGADDKQALEGVVDLMVQETLVGTERVAETA